MQECFYLNCKISKPVSIWLTTESLHSLGDIIFKNWDVDFLHDLHPWWFSTLTIFSSLFLLCLYRLRETKAFLFSFRRIFNSICSEWDGFSLAYLYTALSIIQLFCSLQQATKQKSILNDNSSLSTVTVSETTLHHIKPCALQADLQSFLRNDPISLSDFSEFHLYGRLSNNK